MKKQNMGTLTASKDANNDYQSMQSNTQNSQSKKNASKQEYGTLTAKADANNDYQ